MDEKAFEPTKLVCSHLFFCVFIDDQYQNVWKNNRRKFGQAKYNAMADFYQVN